MKKRYLLLIALIMMLCFTGCGSSDQDDKSDVKISDVEEKEVTEDATEESSTDIQKEEASDSSSSSNSSEGITEQVVFDQDGYKVTALSFEEDSLSGMKSVQLQLENNSEGNCVFQLVDVSVNGLMIDPLFSADVTAGNKANSSMDFYNYALEDNGIEKIASIEFKVSVCDPETWDQYVLSDAITLETSASGSYVQEYNSDGEVIYDENEIKVVAMRLDTSDDILGQELEFYIENNSDAKISVSSLDVAVNGLMMEPLFYCDILPDKKANTAMSFLDLETNGIETIEEIAFKINIMDYNSYETIGESELVTLTFE